MIIQESTRENFEKAWVNVLNAEGATITSHHPVMRIQIVAASIGSNLEAALPSTAMSPGGLGGGVIGLADEDIPAGDIGLVQVYGYHESVRAAALAGNVQIIPGEPLGQHNNRASVGVVSLAASAEAFAVALDTIGTELSANLTQPQYANHVFIRAC